MNALLSWITANPQAVKGYLIALLALVSKGILAVSGKTADLGVWSSFVDQLVDVVVGGFTIYGLSGGIIHTARGPALTAVDQASVIVAALAPAPVPQAVAQVQAIAADVVAVKVPPAETVETPHRF
jgi:hypothetical protein